MMKHRIVVLGGGIKGTAVAALLSLQPRFEVLLIEQNLIASGTTRTNHGRLHWGTASWRSDSDELMRRRRAASELMQQIPGVTSVSSNGVYCFEDSTDLDVFLRRCEENKMRQKSVGAETVAGPWVSAERYVGFVQLSEFSFNPAVLAGRFAAFAIHNGASILVRSLATHITRREQDTFLINIVGQPPVIADCIINCTSRWCNDVQIDGVSRLRAYRNIDGVFHEGEHLDEIEWHSWRLLCLRAEAVPVLDRVTVAVDRARNAPSVIPHYGWITIDGQPRRTLLASRIDDYRCGWRPLNLDDEIDHKLFVDARDFFAPLRLGPQSQNYLFSFAGVHGRIKNATPGSRSTLYRCPDCPNYYVAFGGQASTSLLDALEVAESVVSTFNRPLTRESMLARLIQQLPVRPYKDCSSMIWDEMSGHLH